MRKLLLLIAFIALSIFAYADTPVGEYVPNQVIVKYKDGIRAMRSLSVYSAERSIMKAGSMPEYVTDNVFLLKTIDNVSDSMDILADDPNIEHVQPNYIYRASKIPNDTRYNSSPYPYKADNGLNLEEAWDIITDAPNILIAIIDSGIALNHEDLKDNILDDGIDASGNIVEEGPGKGTDRYGHGTHVAGIAGAVGNNSKGIAGVAWKVKLLSVKTLADDGKGTTATMTKGIEYAIKKNANIMNASLGGNGLGWLEYEAIEKAINAGIVFVGAAGNSNCNSDSDLKNVVGGPEYPASIGIRGVISVGNSGEQSTKYSSSCYGQTTTHLFAPGSNIFSAQHDNNAGYTTMTGTSMSSPFVAGSVALLLAKKPQLKPSQVEMILINSVREVNELKDKSMAGGVLDVKKMLEFNTNSLYEPPSSFTIKKRDNSNRTVDLAWVSNPLAQTEIWYRDLNTGSYKFLDRVAPGVTSYTDKPDNNFSGQRYYRIRSLKRAVYSPFVRTYPVSNYAGQIEFKEYIDIINRDSDGDIQSATRYNVAPDLTPYVDAPIIFADKPSLTFTAQPINITSASQQVKITNRGTAGTIIGLSSSNNVFDIDNASTCLNYKSSELGIEESCTVDITFKPTIAGDFRSVITVDATSNKIEINTSGIAIDDTIDWKLAVSPLSIDFLEKTINKYSADVIVTVTNVGGKELTVTIDSAPDGFVFSNTSTCKVGTNNLLSSKDCKLAIQFNPKEEKRYSGEVNFKSSGGNKMLTLVGIGVSKDTDNETVVTLPNPQEDIETPKPSKRRTPPARNGGGGCSMGNGSTDSLLILLILSLLIYSSKIVMRGRSA